MKDFLTGLPWVAGGIAAISAVGYGMYLLYGVIGEYVFMIIPGIMLLAGLVVCSIGIGYEINFNRRMWAKTSAIPPRGGSGASDARETGQTQ